MLLETLLTHYMQLHWLQTWQGNRSYEIVLTAAFATKEHLFCNRHHNRLQCLKSLHLTFGRKAFIACNVSN